MPNEVALLKIPKGELIRIAMSVDIGDTVPELTIPASAMRPRLDNAANPQPAARVRLGFNLCKETLDTSQR